MSAHATESGTILDGILHWKRIEVDRAKRTRTIEDVRRGLAEAPAPRDLVAALRVPGVSLIAEIKRASPSKGLIRADLDAVTLAREYEISGAAAISVLTDRRFFQGDLDDLRTVRKHVGLPVLRKDFILDSYQVYEARAAGADALLLITAALGDDELLGLYQLTRALGMCALVEVHSEAELERALQVGPDIIGVNNRDLRTFRVDLETTARLRPLVPADVILVAESGVHTQDDVARLAEIGADAMLVGESLVRAPDTARKVRELLAG